MPRFQLVIRAIDGSNITVAESGDLAGLCFSFALVDPMQFLALMLGFLNNNRWQWYDSLQ